MTSAFGQPDTWKRRSPCVLDLLCEIGRHGSLESSTMHHTGPGASSTYFVDEEDASNVGGG